MEPAELDNALEELEIRVERLRALYEQYFLGIEKIEPAVARKDVDRRIWALRRVQIRNTGKRFKLTTIIQRYNTFQQYWQRICREIENGTYRRHLMRATKTFGEEQALTIAARKRLGMLRRGEQAAAEREASGAQQARAAAGQLEQDFEAVLASRLDPVNEIRRAMDEALGASSVPPPAPEAPQQVPIPRPPAVPHEPQPAGPTASRKLAPTRSGPATAGRPSAQPALAASGSAGTPRAALGSTERRPLPAPQARLSQARRSPSGQPDNPKPQANSPSKTPSDQRRPARPRPPAGAAQPTSGQLSDKRIKQLHAQLVEARRRTNDPARVTEEGLARSLRAAEAKLRAQHGHHRRVDFDVIVKNGKAVVKPIVR